MKYNSVYPLFEYQIDNALLKAQKRFELERLQRPERKFLIELIDSLQKVKNQLIKKPAISNVNMEWLINERYKEDRTLHGVQLYVSFKHNPDLGKFSIVKINIAK